MGLTRHGYERSPSTIEATIDAVRGQRAAEQRGDYDAELDGMQVSTAFALDLCLRVLQLERMLRELAAAVGQLRRVERVEPPDF